jgi:glutathione S-transferase
MALQLLIGNKNYSSWSMRPWVLMRGLALPFEERRLRLAFGPGSAMHAALEALARASGRLPMRVPVLVLDDGFVVWDTLAIVETLHELFPAAGVWPAGAHERARARSLCAEMHAGFGALRQHCPMNIEADLAEAGARVWAAQPAVRQDVARLEQAWGDALAASGGPWLFGDFGAADAFFAPVCMRVRTYALPVAGDARAYLDRLAAAPAVQQWVAEARAEHDFIAEDEPYRSSP